MIEFSVDYGRFRIEVPRDAGEIGLVPFFQHRVIISDPRVRHSNLRWDQLEEGMVYAINRYGLDRDNAGLLQYAAEHGLYDAVQRFVAAGAEVNQQDRHGVSPLHRAVRGTFMVYNGGAGVGVIPGRHLDVINFLLSAGADPDLRDQYGQTPFHYCATSSFEIFERLQAVADATIVDLDGRTPPETVALYHLRE